MSKIFKAYVYEHEAHEELRGYFTGEIVGVYMNTNVRELQNVLCEFTSDTRKELLAKMVSFLAGKGETGVLRIVKN